MDKQLTLHIVTLLTGLLGVYLMFDVIKKVFKPKNEFNKRQDELKSKACKGMHDYITVGDNRICNDCGFMPSYGVYGEAENISAQIELNHLVQVEMNKMNKEVQKIFDKYNITEEQIQEMTLEVSSVKESFEKKRNTLIKQALHNVKEKKNV